MPREKEMHTGGYTCTAIYRSRDTLTVTHSYKGACMHTHILRLCAHTHTHRVTHTHTHTHTHSKIPDSKREKRGKH